MELKQLTDNWKCIGIIVATAVALCGTAIGFDERYAKQVDLKQLQLSSNYSNFQMRLAALENLCAKSECSPNDRATIQWLKQQIRLIESQMGMPK
jgi:hypothetical protein